MDKGFGGDAAPPDRGRRLHWGSSMPTCIWNRGPWNPDGVGASSNDRKGRGEDDTCNRTRWDVLANRTLVLDFSVDRCMIVAESRDIPVDDAAVICSLESRITALQSRLLSSNPSCADDPPTPAAARRSGEAQEQT